MARVCWLPRLAYVSSLVWIVGIADTPLFAQRCRADAANEQIATGGWVSPDGRIHYTIRVDPDVPDGVRAAVDRARKDWNALSAETNVVLEIASTPSTRAELTIRRTNDQARHYGCSSFATASSIVYYSIADYEDWVASNKYPQAGVVVMSHEIGHFLGLDEAPAAMNSIMAQGYPPCEGYARMASIRWPTAADGKAVGECIRTHRSVMLTNESR